MKLTEQTCEDNGYTDDPVVTHDIMPSVLARLPHIFVRDMLIKPLPDTKVTKEIIKPVFGDTVGDEIIQSETETSTEEVLANFAEGIVLAMPHAYQWPDPDNHPEVGDKVVYGRKGVISFDLFKDSLILNPYNILAWVKQAA